MACGVMSDAQLEESSLDNWVEELNEAPSNPVEADDPTEFTAAVWNRYGGGYDTSEIRDLTLEVSENWERLGYEELGERISILEDSEKEFVYGEGV